MNDQLQVQNRIPNQNFVMEQMQNQSITNLLQTPYRTIMGLNRFKTIQNLQNFISGIFQNTLGMLGSTNDIDQIMNCSRFCNYNSSLP